MKELGCYFSSSNELNSYLGTKNKVNLFPFLFEEKRDPGIANEDILVVNNLCKEYPGNVLAVNNISFKIKRNSLFAFLGLNGAGKSTTINIITSILPKTSGKIYVDGYDLDKYSSLIKNYIGIVFQNSVLDDLLSPLENLNIRAGFYGIKKDVWEKRLKVLIEMLGLESFLKKPLKQLSGGQRRRVDIARAMVNDPKILILDEPTTGLDPQTRISVWNLINKLRQDTGMTVFLTTHYMEEAEKASYAVIMNKGKIIAEGTPVDLKNRYSGDYVLSYSKRNDDFEKLLISEGRKYTYIKDNSYYKIVVKDSVDAINFIESHKSLLLDFEVQKGSMDDVFLNVTGVNK